VANITGIAASRTAILRFIPTGGAGGSESRFDANALLRKSTIASSLPNGLHSFDRFHGACIVCCAALCGAASISRDRFHGCYRDSGA
jgi:hypothetical protein